MDNHLPPGVQYSRFWPDIYEWIKYGKIPGPDAVKLPTPAAPETESEMTSWTPDQMYQGTADKTREWAQQLRDAIAAAEASGSYTPNGALGLGLGASTWGYLLLGGAVVAAVFAVKFVVRR